MNSAPHAVSDKQSSKRAALAALGLKPSKSLPDFAHSKWTRDAQKQVRRG